MSLDFNREFNQEENYFRIMNFAKLFLLFINPLTISIMLFVPLMSLDSHGAEESIIPESNVTDGSAPGGENLGGESVIPESDVTGGDGSGGGNLGGESVIPESDITQGILVSEDGTITATPEIIARLDVVAISLIDDLNTGTVQVVDANGEIVSVHIDTQQIIASILEQNSNITGGSTPTEISINDGSTLIDVTPADFVDAIFNAVGEDIIFVNTDDFDVTITLVGADNSLNIKSFKTTNSNKKRQTLSIKTVNKVTGKTKTRIVTGTPEQVKSAASTITALTIAGASSETIDVAEEIALGSGIQPDLLVSMMLNYEGLFDRNSNAQASLSDAPQVAMSRDINDLLIAEEKKAVVDIPKFANSIQAYNQVVKKSQPEVFEVLTQIPEFQIIGETLSRLRQSI